MPEFLHLILGGTAIRRQIDDLSRGGVQGFVGINTLRNLLIAVPAVAEQRAIVEYIGELTQPHSAAIRSSRHEISLLREYRTRLIADVVTGKLDVREAALLLPDEDPLRDFAASREPDLDETDDNALVESP